MSGALTQGRRLFATLNATLLISVTLGNRATPHATLSQTFLLTHLTH